MKDKGKKIYNNKAKAIKPEKKNVEHSNLTYTMGDKLDELFPQYKSSKKKEENK